MTGPRFGVERSDLRPCSAGELTRILNGYLKPKSRWYHFGWRWGRFQVAWNTELRPWPYVMLVRYDTGVMVVGCWLKSVVLWRPHASPL